MGLWRGLLEALTRAYCFSGAFIEDSVSPYLLGKYSPKAVGYDYQRTLAILAYISHAVQP